MGKKHTGIFVSNSVEMHLLHDCEDLVSIHRELVSDVVDGMQTNLYGKSPYLANVLKNLMTQYSF